MSQTSLQSYSSFIYVGNWLDPSGRGSRVWIYGRLLAEVAGSNSSGGMYVYLSCVLCTCCLCDEPISSPEESYRVWCA